MNKVSKTLDLSLLYLRGNLEELGQGSFQFVERTLAVGDLVWAGGEVKLLFERSPSSCF